VSKIRLQFSKTGTLRFIGHLDFLRVFQQTIRRAGLPSAFSQGFNPHLLISFALPLPLGMESVNDYADIVLEEEVAAGEIIKRLNAAAPDGLVVKKAYPVENKAASIVKIADYIVRGGESSKVRSTAEEGRVGEFLQAAEIIVAKKTKKGVKDTDIRADIFDLRFVGGDLHMRLSAGSERFLNPLIVAGLVFGEGVSPSAVSRMELYREDERGGSVTL